MATIGLEVVKTGMVTTIGGKDKQWPMDRSSHGIKRHHGGTAHHPQSAVAIRVGGTKTQSAVATGGQM